MTVAFIKETSDGYSIAVTKNDVIIEHIPIKSSLYSLLYLIGLLYYEDVCSYPVSNSGTLYKIPVYNSTVEFMIVC